MAKSSKPKNVAAVSKHSRAARRATSPSINTDKSLKDVEPPTEPKRPLGVHHGAGITKRKAKGKQLTRAQKARQERTLARAEAVMHQMDKKKEKSSTKEKTIKGRSVAWEDINEKVGDKARARRRPDAGSDGSDEWEDTENVDMAEVEASADSTATHDVGQDTVPATEQDAEEPEVS